VEDLRVSRWEKEYLKGAKIVQTDTKIAIFKGRKIRKMLYSNEWWFSVVDVVEALTDSDNSRDYWYKMKIRDKEESGVELSTICRQLKLIAPDGKLRETDCADTEGIFRIIQSIPSPKAEPFKRWLAKAGYERIQEIEDPELATKRTRMLYKLKGYSDDWIEKRMRGIAIREELTDEWQRRGAQEEKDYEILTAQISKAAFGVTPEEYKKFKELKRENLRDHKPEGSGLASYSQSHMDDFELIFTMLGERATTEIHRTEDSQGTNKLQADAHAGGTIAGDARKALEKRLKRPIVSGHNYLKEKELRKRVGV
jgi:DNA-damage-inducible protein D